MIYQKLIIWKHHDELWHALRGHPNSRDLSMSQITESQLAKTIEWAKMHKLEIDDQRTA